MLKYMSNKKLLLLPTTEHAFKSFELIYHAPKHQHLVANVSKNSLHIPCDFKEQTKFWRVYYTKFRIIRLLAYFFLGRLFLKKIQKFLISNNINGLVVSNDCGFPQVYFITAAKRLGLKTVCHQVASGSIGGIRTHKSLKNMVARHLKEFIHANINGLPLYKRFGDVCDVLVLLGDGWARDLKITRKYLIFENPKYFHGLQINHDNNRKKIIIFGVPLKEVPLVSSDVARRCYKKINLVAQALEEKGIEIFYKPHPQELFYKELIDIPLFEGDIKSAFESFSICMSVSSTVCLEFRLSGRISVALNFDFLPATLVNQTKGLFSFNYKDLLDMENMNQLDFSNTSIDLDYYGRSECTYEDIISAI